MLTPPPIHVWFRCPLLLIGGAPVLLLLDGTLIFRGGFRDVDVTVPATAGPHHLEAVIDLGIIQRRRSWQVTVPPEGCDVVLAYSRFWGSFRERVRVEPYSATPIR
jgi:hypothetical protein